MGSDIGKKLVVSSSSFWSTIKLLISFLLGCFVTKFTQQDGNSNVQKRRSSGSSNCEISFGTYKGHQYKHDESTVGQPKCLVESKFLKVQQHAVKLNPNQQSIIDDWIWIDYHDRINVLIESGYNDYNDSNNEPTFLVFKQTKYALEGRDSLAIVGGIIEPGEKPEHAAKREVQEETNMDCNKFHFLGRYRTDVNRGMGWTNTYLARDCTKIKSKNKQQRRLKQTTNQDDDEEEEVGIADTERQDMVTIGLKEIRKAVQDGKFLEIQWSATVALAMLYHDELKS